jgi:RHS repeat-associated protein
MERQIFTRDTWFNPWLNILLAIALVFGMYPIIGVGVLAQTEKDPPKEIPPAPAEYIVISPADATITAGQSLSYSATAFDAEENSWDITTDTSFSIDHDAGGSWLDNTYTSEFAGTWAVTGTYDSFTDSTILTVDEAPPGPVHPGPAEYIVISPADATVIAGQSQSYSATAFDLKDNSWDVTDDTSFSIDADAGGSWVDNVYTSEYASTWTVTAIYGSLNYDTNLIVERAPPEPSPGPAEYIVISPSDTTLTSGQPQSYTATAFDLEDNSWDVTIETSFSIEIDAGGSWADNIYTSEFAGTWTVTATYDTLTDSTTLIVEEAPPEPVHPGPAEYMVISPTDAIITAGQSQSYSATAFDAEENSWDITAETIFSIDVDAGGSWANNTYASEFAGTWAVIGKYDNLVDDVILTIEELPPEEKEKQPQLSDKAPNRVAVLVSPDEEVELKSPSGKIDLRIPKGAVTKPVEVELVEHSPWGSTGRKMVSLFELNANLVESGEKVSQFNTNLEISIKHDPAELKGLNIESLQLYYLDEESRQWVPVSTSHYESKDMAVTASITHFSYYGEQADPVINGPGKVMAVQVNLNAGSANFNYPIELPPGPGGFQPKLELTYDSSSVDEMKNKRSTGSWVGIGWNLHLGRISMDLDTGLYYLDLNNASYRLASSDGTNYRTNPDQYFKIVRSGNTWELWDREGVYHRFGGTEDSEQYYMGDYYRWDLSIIRDTNGNEATVSYVQITTGYPSYVRSAYPEYLDYNNVEVQFNSSHDEFEGHHESNMRRDNPTSTDENPAPAVMETRKLDSIEVKVSDVLIRKYTFDYDTTDCVYSDDYGGIYYSGKHCLTSITEVGADGTSELPSMTFTYDDLEIFRNGNEDEDKYYGNPGNPASLFWPYLIGIDSGYGGTISFSYNQLPDTHDSGVWTREIVKEKTIDGGIGDIQSYTYTYIGGPRYLWASWDQKFRGFDQVIETDGAGNYVWHWFYTTGEINGKDAEKLSGREYKTQWYDSSEELLSETDYDWTWQTTSEDYDLASVWSRDGAGDGIISDGKGIEASGDGYVYVTDAGNDQGQKFDEHGNFEFEFGGEGTWNGQLTSSGIAVSSDGYIYATDFDNDQVRKFDSDGNLIQMDGIGIGQGFKNPEGVAISDDGYMYVVDPQNNRVLKLDTDGNFILEWGSYGTDDGQFNNPKGIAVSSDGDIYVADTGNNRIQKFNADGDFILKWGGEGTGESEFKNPQGIAVSEHYDDVYVVDTGNNRIQKFDAYGSFILAWGSEGADDGQFENPEGISIRRTGGPGGGDDYVYVADTGNKRIQEFSTSGSFIRKWNSYGTYGYYQPYGGTPHGIKATTSSVYVTTSGLDQVVKFESDGDYLLAWGDEGSEDGYFKDPRGIAMDYPYVYVADTHNDRIQKFNTSGEFISIAVGQSQLMSPYGIAVSSEGDGYVVDSGNNQIQKFDTDGNCILKWGSEGTGEGQFRDPTGIAVSSDGYVYVVDTDNSRIQKFYAEDGEFVSAWGSVGSGNGQFVNPCGIVVSSDGYIYVADTNNDRIQKFNSDGSFNLAWGSHGTGDGQFWHPYGIAAYNGCIYVADTNNDRIQKFDADDGEFILKWGTEGTGEGEFQNPEDIAVSSSGYVYVADTDNSRVQRFDTDGEYVPMEGSGIGEGQLLNPDGVAVSGDGDIYVIEPDNDQVKKYDDEGNYVLKWGTEGTGEGEFQNPSDITVSSDGYVYVADTDNDRVQKFNYDGSFNLAWGSSGTGDGYFNDPKGIAASTDGYVYIADTNNDRIQKFDADDGEFITTWGGYGTGDGQLKDPDGIAVSSDGYVYVVDTGNGRMQKFDADGEFITKWDDYEDLTVADIAVTTDYMYWMVSDVGVYEFTRNWAVQLSGVEVTTLPDSVEPKTSKTEYEYDDYGNVTVEYLYGDLDTSDDDTTIYRVFYPNEELNILSRPAEEQVYATITDPQPRYEILRPNDAGDETSIEFGFPGSGLNFFINAVDVTPGTAGYWQDIDVSSYIPAGSTGVILWLKSGYSTDVGIRKNGSTDDYYCLYGSGQGIIVGVDANRVFEAMMESVDSSHRLYLVGYTDSNVTLFDNCIDKSTDTTGSYVDVDISGDGVPSGATGAIFFFHNTGTSDYDCALRKNGSSDDVYGEVEGDASGGVLWGVVGLDNNLVCEQKIENTAVDLKLIGYTKAPVTFLDNAVDESLTTTDSWVDIDLTGDTTENSDGAIFSIINTNHYNPSWGLQHKDSTDDYTEPIWTYSLLWRCVGLDSGQLCEGYISYTAVDFYLRGYTYPAAQHWEDVDESNHDGDTSSVSSNEADYQRDLYNIDDHSAASGEINSVTAYAICRADDTPTQDGLKIVIKSGEGTGAPDTVSESSEMTVTDSYTVYSNQWSTNPATDDAWTWDEIDNLQVGVAVRSSGDSYHTYCTQTYVEVEYSIVDEDSLKSETLYYYDENDLTTPPDEGNLTQLKQRVSEEEEDYITSSFTYDSYGNMLTSQDPNGNIMTWTYETTHHTYPETVTSPDPDNFTESYTYDPGTLNPLSLTDFNDQTTTYQYDTFKRLIKVIKPGDSEESPSIEYQYNDWGNLNQQHLKTLTKVAEDDYLWQSQYFDGLGRVLQVHSRGEVEHTIISATTAYNNIGLVDKNYLSQDLDSSEVDGYMAPEASWKYTSYEYDSLGRVTVQTYADGTTISHDYSTAWQEVVTNERGYEKYYYFDAFERLIKIEELDDSYQVYATTEYSYNVMGNLVQVEDNDSNTITITYDWLSRKTEMIDPDMGSWSYEYDDNGNLVSQTDAKGQTITFTYDELNRLTGKSYPQGSGMTDVTYTYDAYEAGVNYGKGQRTGMNDAIGTTSYKYDTWGRLTEETRTIDSVPYSTQFTYDGANRVTSITYPTGEMVTQEYNERGLPYSLSGSVVGELVTSTLYNYLGQVNEIYLGNGLSTIYGYWDVGTIYDTTGGYYGKLWRVQTAQAPWHDMVVQDEKYTWDEAGNMTQREDVLTSERETFTYDFLDRLTSASGPYSESYTYDEIGNITSKNGVSYTYGSQPHAVTAVGETSYNYDDNGNMTDRGSQDITWDVENRIIEVDDGENTSTFVYDGNGNRVKKTEGGETILYVNKYYEKNLTTGEVTTYYYHGGKLVAMCQDTELKYVHQDHLTSTSVMTDNSGNELGTVKYFPFGATRSGSVPTDKKFTGKRLDETGLYYYGARYYDANIGRFISADTMITDFTNPQTLNRYSYCLNNPLKYTDPSGHGIFDDIVEKAKKIIKSAGDAFKTGYNAAKSWVSSTYQSAASNVQSTYQGFTSTMSNAGNSAIDALVNFGKSLVEGAAAKCEPSLQANKAAGDSGVGGSNPVYDSVSSAINNTITPALNSTGAGITSVYVKNGYTGVNFAEGGWGVAAMKLLGFYVDEPAALTLANPAYGLGLFPPPASSLVLVRNELEDPRTRSHEEGHVVENLTLGGPVYSSMYGLGMLLYEHSENPFEVLANKYASP